MDIIKPCVGTFSSQTDWCQLKNVSTQGKDAKVLCSVTRLITFWPALQLLRKELVCSQTCPSLV